MCERRLREAALLDAELDAALDAGPSPWGLDGDTVGDAEQEVEDADGDSPVEAEDSLLQAGGPSPRTHAGDNIHVFVRVRPPNSREGSAPSRDIVRINASEGTVRLLAEPPRQFAFDGVVGESSSQEQVFKLVGTDVAEACLEGYNGSIYVYGQTGSGKTYTMQGPVSSVQSMHADERRGIMCRIFDHIFTEVNTRHREAGNVEYSCKCSYLEIYKEQLTDLLHTKDLQEPGSTNLQVREDINRGVYVERLSEHSVWTLSDALHVLWKGLHQRHVGATQMNELSSRSHAVFTLMIEATSTTSGGVTSTRVARLNLVDLAGSERQSYDPSNSTLHESLRVKEAGAINRSLSALTNVIMSLSHAGRRRSSAAGNRRSFVRYRDSKLTFLLRDSLGGNSKTVIVACVSPSALCFGETLSTLKFAARAKHIRCTAVQNEEYSGTVESLMLEVKSLKQQLELLQSRGLIPGDIGTMSQASFAPIAESAQGRRSRCPSDADVEADSVEGFIICGNDELRRLYGPRRIRRLEILLAAALERERRCELKRHKLDKFTQYLNGLLERKEKYFDALRDYFALLVDHFSAEACFRPEFTARLIVFRQQLCSLSTDSRKLAAEMLHGIVEGIESGEASEDNPELPKVSASTGDLGMRSAQNCHVVGQPAGQRSQSYSFLTGEALRRGTRRGTSQSLQLRSASSRMLRSMNSPVKSSASSATLVSTGSCDCEEPSCADEEVMLLRTENRLLRRQLESHPELHRLHVENRLLREHLASLMQQHALAREEPPWPTGHKHHRRAMAGTQNVATRDVSQPLCRLTRERSLTRTSRSSLLGHHEVGEDSASPKGKQSGLRLRQFPGIGDATQISPSSSSAESDAENSDLGMEDPVRGSPASGDTGAFATKLGSSTASSSARGDGRRAGGDRKGAGTVDAASFLPMMAREVEELLRVKAGLEESVRQLVRSLSHTADPVRGVRDPQASQPGWGIVSPTQDMTEVEVRAASDIMQGASQALRFAEGILAKGKGETLLLSATGGQDGEGGEGASPVSSTRAAEGLDERDVFLSLMRSLPKDSPSLSRQGFAMSAPHLSPSRIGSTMQLGNQRAVMGSHSASDLRTSSSTGSAGARLMRQRSTMDLRFSSGTLQRIAEQPTQNVEPSLPSAASALEGGVAHRPSPEAPGHLTTSNDLLKEAVQKVRQIVNSLELISDAYRGMREQLRPLQDEFNRRLEECRFLESQCRRLDVHCRLLEQRALTIEGAGSHSRPQLLTSLPSSTGLQATAAAGQRHWFTRYRASGGRSEVRLPISALQDGGSERGVAVDGDGRSLLSMLADTPVSHGIVTSLSGMPEAGEAPEIAGSASSIFRGATIFPDGIDAMPPAAVQQGTSVTGSSFSSEPPMRSASTASLMLASVSPPHAEVQPRGLLYPPSIQEDLRRVYSAPQLPVVPAKLDRSASESALRTQALGTLEASAAALGRAASGGPLPVAGGAVPVRAFVGSFVPAVRSASGGTPAMSSVPAAGGAAAMQASLASKSVPEPLQVGETESGESVLPASPGGSTFNSLRFLNLAKQPGDKSAALQYLMTSTSQALGAVGKDARTRPSSGSSPTRTGASHIGSARGVGPMLVGSTTSTPMVGVGSATPGGGLTASSGGAAGSAMPAGNRASVKGSSVIPAIVGSSARDRIGPGVLPAPHSPTLSAQAAPRLHLGEGPRGYGGGAGGVGSQASARSGSSALQGQGSSGGAVSGVASVQPLRSAPPVGQASAITQTRKPHGQAPGGVRRI